MACSFWSRLREYQPKGIGSQYVATKVRTVADAAGAVDVMTASGARPWQADPFGLDELAGPE